MTFADLLMAAVRSLSKNRLRTSLTMFGVVIGISAVTTMVSLGQSASAFVGEQFQSLGSNMIIVMPAQSLSGGVSSGTTATLTAGDAEAIGRECTSVMAVSPAVSASAQVIGGNINCRPKEVLGVGVDYLVVRDWKLAEGEFFTPRDVNSAAKVCVLGQTVAQRLFAGESPIGRPIRIKNTPFRITGLLDRKGANLFGQDQDDIVLMPYTTASRRLQGSEFRSIGLIQVSAVSQESMKQAEIEVRALLTERHRIPAGQPADFEVRNTTEVSNVLSIVTTSLTVMLSAIAAISLFVGGVGIMNIMLVSVTERTREIGIRMALGARPRDILRQFLVEAVLLSSLGGAVGVGGGIAASAVLTALVNAVLPNGEWPFRVSISTAIVALVFSSLVGVFFGYYPARSASRLDPIDALRYE